MIMTERDNFGGAGTRDSPYPSTSHRAQRRVSYFIHFLSLRTAAQ